MRVVFIASPFAGDRSKNEAYARAAMRDAIGRGEAPFAPHLLYTQVMDDANPKHRALSMRMGIHVLRRCDAVVLYVDLGVSSGMNTDAAAARKAGVKVEERRIPMWLSEEQAAGFINTVAATRDVFVDEPTEHPMRVPPGRNVAEVKIKLGKKRDDDNDPESGPALGSA